MIHRILLASAVTLSIFATVPLAHAADAIVEAPVDPVFTWSGAYVGIHAGYGFGRTDAEFSIPDAPGFDATQDYSTDGFVGGVQVGYNYQFGQAVVGAEADFSGSGVDGDSGEINAGRGDKYTTDLDWLGTVRARLGYAFDRTLVYGTGGFAYGKVENQYLDGPFNSFSEEHTETGYALGAGVEHAFTDHLTAKLEYLFADLGDQTIEYGGLDNNTVFDNEFHSVRIGLNYKF